MSREHYSGEPPVEQRETKEFQSVAEGVAWLRSLDNSKTIQAMRLIHTHPEFCNQNLTVAVLMFIIDGGSVEQIANRPMTGKPDNYEESLNTNVINFLNRLHAALLEDRKPGNFFDEPQNEPRSLELDARRTGKKESSKPRRKRKPSASPSSRAQV